MLYNWILIVLVNFYSDSSYILDITNNNIQVIYF